MKTLNRKRSIGLYPLLVLAALVLIVPAIASIDDSRAYRNEGAGDPWYLSSGCGDQAFTLNAPAVFVQTLGTEDGAFSNPTGQVIADQFILSMDATITSVTWYGFYGVDLDPSVAALNFDIHFFEDSAGLPGTEIYDATVSAKVNDSGFKVTNPDPDYYFNGRTIYEFQADLDSTLSITAGDTMWIEIAENDDSTEPTGDTQWLWSNGRPVPIIPATIEIKPETLNLKSKGVFTAFIDLLEGYDEQDIDISTVQCEGAPALKGKMADHGRLIVKFDRKDLVGVSPGDAVELVVTGQLNDGTHFIGSDTIRVNR